jgi:hypothetical protein
MNDRNSQAKTPCDRDCGALNAVQILPILLNNKLIADQSTATFAFCSSSVQGNH